MFSAVIRSSRRKPSVTKLVQDQLRNDNCQVFADMSTNSEFTTASVVKLLKAVVDYPLEDRVVDFVQPAILEKDIEQKFFSKPNLDELHSITNFVLSKCVNTSHRYFLNQLYGGVHPVGLVASVLVEKMNTNQHTFEVAPVFILAERIILRELRKLFFGTETGDGIFSPGGSIANMYAMVLARNRDFPDTKQKGIFNLPPLAVFTSEDAHYSVSKAANWMGLGLNNVIKVKTGDDGALLPEALQAAITACRSQGMHPLIVVATAGTTVLGAFDPFVEISKICQKENIWLHCDAAWGGSFIFSPRLRGKWMNGINLCDSVAWNAHKMLCAPLQCSAFICKEENALLKCNSLTASYLFQQDKFYPPSYDIGDKSIQCGRKPDAFKLWYMWMTLGTEGFQDLVENAEDCARHITDTLKSQKDFIVYLNFHQCTNVFFWYVPPRLQGQPKTEEWWNELSIVTTKIKEKMVLDGRVMIGYSPIPHKGIVNAIRLVIPAYPKKTHQDMDFIVSHLRSLGKDL